MTEEDSDKEDTDDMDYVHDQAKPNVITIRKLQPSPSEKETNCDDVEGSKVVLSQETKAGFTKTFEINPKTNRSNQIFKCNHCPLTTRKLGNMIDH